MDLLACPFCGETTEFRVVGGTPGTPVAFVVCGTCHTRGPGGESLEQAKANWNRRPTDTLQGSPSWLRRQLEGHVDDLAAARDRRDLAVDTHVALDGLEMDFDTFGAPQPAPKPPKR